MQKFFLSLLDPGSVPLELVVSVLVTVVSFTLTWFSSHLIVTGTDPRDAVMPIMSVYRLPQGQYGYSGHVVNLPQDVASFVQSLPRLPSELDVIEPSGLPCQTCSGAQSSPVAGHTQPVLPLSRK